MVNEPNNGLANKPANTPASKSFGKKLPRAQPIPQLDIRHTVESIALQEDLTRLSPHNLSPARSGGNSFTYNRGVDRESISSKNSVNGDSLGDQLRWARIEYPRHSYSFFIPICQLDSIITTSNVESEIQRGNSYSDPAGFKHIAEETCRIARKVFAVLACMGRGFEIEIFLRDGVSDEDLPVRGIKNENGGYELRRRSGAPIETFESWNDHDKEEFDRTQWWMLSPVFCDKEHYELEESTILPFIPFETGGEIEKKSLGGFSEVYAARIHRSHHKFWEGSKLLVGKLDKNLMLLSTDIIRITNPK